MYFGHWALLVAGLLSVNAYPNAGNTKPALDVAEQELPENWDQTKDNQSLFQNKDAKNDLEPYTLALVENGLKESDSQTETQNLGSAYYGEPPAFSQMYGGRAKRGGGTKVGGAGAGATKVATKNNGGKKNFRLEANRLKRDSAGLTAADVKALLAMWEAQERRKQEQNRWAERYFSRNADDDEQQDFDDDNEVWLNEAVPMNEFQPSYFSEQNRYAQAYPQRQYYGERTKRYMIPHKRSEGQIQYRPREDLYTLAELLRVPRRDESYRRHIM